MIDALELPFDDADRNEEFGPDRPIRETFGDEAQHFQLIGFVMQHAERHMQQS